MQSVGTSLVVIQWLRLLTPTAWVRSLLGELGFLVLLGHSQKKKNAVYRELYNYEVCGIRAARLRKRKKNISLDLNFR